MIIKLSPVFSDRRQTVSVAGDVVTIDGVDYDFTPLEIGASIPAEAIDQTVFDGEVSRDDAGELVMKIIYYHGYTAPYDSRFPLPLSITEDGPVTLPPTDEEVVPDPEPEIDGELTA